jgi:hypothetical protein
MKEKPTPSLFRIIFQISWTLLIVIGCIYGFYEKKYFAASILLILGIFYIIRSVRIFKKYISA